LLPGHLTPSLLQSMARLGTWMPFDRAVRELGFFARVDVPEPTLRRHVQAAGAAYVALQEQAVERLERTLPPAPPGPAVQQISVDGAMVSLVHKEWAEVRTLAVGVVEKPVMERGEPVVHTGQVSYFSRLCDADTFGRLATVETHRRGTENAGTVCAVVDGAEWEQGFIDLQCPKAVRILDFGHAGEHVAAAGRVVYGEDTEALRAWLGPQLHTLKHEQPEMVVGDLQRLKEGAPGGQAVNGDGVHRIDEQIGYLEKRYEQMRYAQFIESGYPIGSGMVESGNKLVVEERLKGAGMHWARGKVNPMLALRNIACSDRWEEAWPEMCAQMRLARQQHRRERRCAKKEPPAELADHPAVAAPETVLPQQAVAIGQPPAQPSPVSSSGPSARRPAAHHPWRRPIIPRGCTRSERKGASPKT
jgi:hypothetical protein